MATASTASSQYRNWDQERESIITEVLREIRDQKDRAQESTCAGKVQFNPQVFTAPGATHLIIGPVGFPNPFSNQPIMSLLHENLTTSTSQIINTSKATSLSPFIVSPYIYKWRYTNGKVDGFWIGLYAINDPDPTVQQNNIHWKAEGRAPRYIDRRKSSSWIEPYSQGSTNFLTHDVATTGDQLTQQ